jgi:hypothetical protein
LKHSREARLRLLLGVPDLLGWRLTERRSDGGGELESVAGGFGGAEDEGGIWSLAASPHVE